MLFLAHAVFSASYIGIHLGGACPLSTYANSHNNPEFQVAPFLSCSIGQSWEFRGSVSYLELRGGSEWPEAESEDYRYCTYNYLTRETAFSLLFSKNMPGFSFSAGPCMRLLRYSREFIPGYSITPDDVSIEARGTELGLGLETSLTLGEHTSIYSGLRVWEFSDVWLTLGTSFRLELQK